MEALRRFEIYFYQINIQENKKEEVNNGNEILSKL